MSSIFLRDIALFFPHKVCFEQVNVCVPYGAKIGLIGQNGCGKSTLLRMLCGHAPCMEGTIEIPSYFQTAYVPQIVPQIVPQATSHTGEALSGGEYLYDAISKAFAQNPDLLLLDEPSNHLDRQRRMGLLRLIEKYTGTIIVVSHDSELLNCMESIWHIHDGEMTIFNGTYDNYRLMEQGRQAQEEADNRALKQQQKKLVEAVQKKQTQNARSKHQGLKKFGNDKMQRGNIKSWGEKNSGKALQRMRDEQGKVEGELRNSRKEAVLAPRFQVEGNRGGRKNTITITDGSVSYGTKGIVQGISLAMSSHERIALHGNNGSGKSTVMQALMSVPRVERRGFWDVPEAKNVWYIDQHYSMLQEAIAQKHTVIDMVQDSMPNSSYADIRRHLNDFLFRKNEEVQCGVHLLSGGERARLCLAVLAARSPELLLLDEMTNNLDRETRQYVITVLQQFPGALVLISHDKEFLDEVGITSHYIIENGTLRLLSSHPMDEGW